MRSAQDRFPHQLAGIACRSVSLSISYEGQDSSLPFGQRNSSSVFKKGVGTRSCALLSKLSCRILKLAFSMNVTMVPRHIAGQLNVLADLASRMGQMVPSEWALSKEAFQWVQMSSSWGPVIVDMFANDKNHRLERYFSPRPD